MKIGPYTIGEKLGDGTVSDAFMASDKGKSAVVKKLRADLAVNHKVAERFLDATNLSSRIKTRRFVATVLMQKSSDDGVFLVREHVEGKSLAQLRNEGGLAALDARQLALDLCDALRALHLRDIVHGGVHPGNVIVQDNGHLKVTDYGISRGALTGTIDAAYPLDALRYLAPEQWKSQETSASTDLFSAALVILLLTEQHDLLDGRDSSTIKQKALTAAASAPTGLAHALHADPARRPANAEQFREAVVAWFASRTAQPAAEKKVEPDKEVPPSIPQPRAVAEPPPVIANESIPGSLQAMRDVEGNLDLLALNHGQPWQLPRTGDSQQWPIYFTNGGPGELCLHLRPLGEGIKLSPSASLRLKPGQSRYTIVTLDAQGSEWARLDVGWAGQKPSQCVQIRMYRST